jgi:hypothetical protein
MALLGGNTLKLTLKGSVILFKNIRGLLNIVVGRFNDLANDCDHYLNNDGLDLCRHNEGDGYCEACLCPLDK